MSEETFEELYGNQGIDTPYEREKITYRPKFNYSQQDINNILRSETKQTIERARTFTISQNLSEYDELIEEIDQILTDLEARNSADLMNQLKKLLSQKQYKDVIEFERQNSGYDATGDFEIYSLLYNMKESCSTRRDFLDEKFRTQITDETEIDKIQEAEDSSISDWEQLEAQVLDAYSTLAESDPDEEEDEDSTASMNYDTVEKLEQQKRNKELLHTSLADTSYIHRNRYFMFAEIVEKAKIIVYQSTSLIDDNLKDFVMSLQDMDDFTAPKAHLVLNFRKVKEKHESLKGRMMTIDDEKETFGSEKQYLYQQLETKTTEPIKNWMYQQEEGNSGALDMFSQYMVDSITDSRETYNKTNADMLNFYKSESDFYNQQIAFLKNKEEIRKFYSIFEDLEDVDQIQGDWVDEYLKVNGYSA